MSGACYKKEDEGMNLYISELHFGHANVIKFDNRPFSDVTEMDRYLIEAWNASVSGEDDVCLGRGQTYLFVSFSYCGVE